MKIISGGQTGVDRAALDFALEHGIEIGGFCPKGRIAEDGVIDLRYDLTELLTNDYSQRTLKNVVSSDATLILYFDKLSGGTLNTRNYCMEEKKPYLLIDVSKKTLKSYGNEVLDWILKNNVQTLNLAGPRHSKCELCYELTKSLLAFVFNSRD